MPVTPERESTWEPTTYQGISTWGRTPIGEDIVHKLTMFRHAVTSSTQTEATVPRARHPGALPVCVH